MRVLTVGNMYPPHHFGGYELTWRSSVLHLRARGDRVRVVTTDWRVPGVREPDDDDVHRELRWYWHDHAFPRMGVAATLAVERHNAAVLERHLEELRPDVVCWWAMGGMSMSLIERARRAGVPGAGVVGDDWMGYGARVDKWHRVRRHLPGGALHLNELEWLFNSERTMRNALKEGWSLPRARVAYPGVDPALFPAAPERPWSWRLAYVGRIEPRKGVGLAIEALKHLPAAATLRIVGGGQADFLDRLRRLASAQDVADRVRFDAVPRERLAAVYAEADALLFPVLWEEPFGLVPLEAMSVGCIVVASGRGGSGEYLEHERNALLFDASAGAPALAAAVRHAADRPELRRRLRQRGFQVAARFTERAYNDAIAAALERAAAA